MMSENWVLSPVVGCIMHDCCVITPEKCEIGRVLRLNRWIDLDLALPRSARYFPLVANGARVEVGAKIGRIEELFGEENVLSHPSDEHQFVEVTSPVAGYLAYQTPNGIDYCKKGQIVCPGDRIATVEFMKLRVDIVLEGNDALIFESYTCSSPASVRAQQVIARLLPCKNSDSL